MEQAAWAGHANIMEFAHERAPNIDLDGAMYAAAASHHSDLGAVLAKWAGVAQPQLDLIPLQPGTAAAAVECITPRETELPSAESAEIQRQISSVFMRSIPNWDTPSADICGWLVDEARGRTGFHQ
jgi:hypothetical protein